MSEVAKAASAGASAAPAASAPSVVPAVVVPTAAPVAPGPGPSPVVRFSPSTPTIQTLPAAVNSGGSSSNEVVAVGPPVLHLLVPGGAPVASGSARAVGSGCVLWWLFQVGFVMFVFLFASVVPAYKFRSAFSVKQAICNVRTGRLLGPVSGALIRVVCAHVLPVLPVSRLLVPSWCHCLRLRWHPRRPRCLLRLQPRLSGLLLLLRFRMLSLRRLQRLEALPIGVVRLHSLRPLSAIPSPSLSLLGSSITWRWRSLCCTPLVLCSGVRR
jgi:hypothetical protein